MEMLGRGLHGSAKLALSKLCALDEVLTRLSF